MGKPQTQLLEMNLVKLYYTVLLFFDSLVTYMLGHAQSCEASEFPTPAWRVGLIQ
jgi:hypothetical protein